MKSKLKMIPAVQRLSRVLLPTVLATAAAQAGAATALPEPWLPLAPGAAQCHVDGEAATLSDAALRLDFSRSGGALRPARLVNGFTKREQLLEGELFSLSLRGSKALAASQFTLDGALECQPIAAIPDAARAADRRAGVALTARFVDAAHGLTVSWRAVLRDGTNYVREEVSLVAKDALDVASIKLVDLKLDRPWVDGTTDGSPLVSREEFFGFEHPMAQSSAIDDHGSAWLKRVLPLRAGVAAQYSAVLGTTPTGQLRRGFQAYLENERATPFRTFLHYNSWYDIGYFTPYTEAEAVNVVNTYGEKLVKQRGVKMDSFLFDDGWDDHNNLWQFSKDFPHGFTPVREAAEKIGAEPGVWLSPWGGYGDPREQRLAAGRAGGYEVDDQGLALSGKKYFPLFHDAAVRLLKQYGINQFKLDGTGSPDKVTPGSDFDSDFAAAISLIDDLRAIKPDLFINLTTGTWPSPFWLRTADSIWRGGEDHSFAGVGTNRQRWITYRDSDTYGGIVRQGPLFPLNSLMLHGMIYARKARGLNTDPHGDFADEVHSYFSTGTGLQEMYISPDLLSEKDWDTLAETAQWARANAVTLRDSHWIGGDPMRGEVYGWASWSPGHAIVTLRNPGPAAASFPLDLARALELPASEARTWSAKPAFSDKTNGKTGGKTAAMTLRAGATQAVTLKPFEVLVLDLSPATAAAAR